MVANIVFDSFNTNCSPQGNKCMFILFYMPNCPYCIAVKPAFDRVAQEHPYIDLYSFDVTTDYNKNMVLKLRDASAIKKYGYYLPSFPTMVIFVNGKATIYKGNRSVEDFGRFIMTNTAKGELCK